MITDLPEKFVDDMGSVIRSCDLSYISKGANSGVWKYDHGYELVAFKYFFPDRHAFSLGYRTYLHMRDLPLKNILKAYHIFSSIDYDHVVTGNFDAYSMPYLDCDPHQKLYEMKLDVLLQNLEFLQSDVSILSDSHILMRDIKSGNSLFSREDGLLHIIDIDMFQYLDTISMDSILEKNQKMLYSLVKSHFFDSISEMNLSIDQIRDLQVFLRYHFSPDEALRVSISDKVDSLFHGCESPKEYFLKRYR